MQKLLLTLFAWLLICAPLQADQILSDLDFTRGNWTLVGVPVHNYRMLPVQTELGTFVCKDRDLLQDLQKDWDFGLTFDDKCDYHYSLKFYRDGELVRTLSLNLYCNYITSNGLSYQFAPEEFDRIRASARQVAWSRINFSDLDVLKKAINTLDRAGDVYWYEDVQQYQYPGFFMLSVNDLPWSADRDSLKDVVDRQLFLQLGTDDFYLQEYFHIVRDDRLFVRYIVNSEPALAERIDHVNVTWRSHLHDRDSVSILAIGIDEQRYRRLMRRK
jgi:hypothetical protein